MNNVVLLRSVHPFWQYAIGDLGTPEGLDLHLRYVRWQLSAEVQDMARRGLNLNVRTIKRS